MNRDFNVTKNYRKIQILKLNLYKYNVDYWNGPDFNIGKNFKC
jgi:hypothetical protein